MDLKSEKPTVTTVQPVPESNSNFAHEADIPNLILC